VPASTGAFLAEHGGKPKKWGYPALLKRPNHIKAVPICVSGIAPRHYRDSNRGKIKGR